MQVFADSLGDAMDVRCVAEKNAPNVRYTLSVTGTEEESRMFFGPSSDFSKAFFVPGTQKTLGTMSFTVAGDFFPIVVRLGYDTVALATIKDASEAVAWVKNRLEDFFLCES